VVNLSLIAVDWYINQMRRKVNESPAINFTISEDAYRGSARNQVLYYSPDGRERQMTAIEALEFIGGDNPIQATTRTLPQLPPLEATTHPHQYGKGRGKWFGGKSRVQSGGQ
jgi:hypothetical protein